MHLLPLTLPTLSENVALDEALLLEAEAARGGEIMRIWEMTSPGVVLGAACILTEDVHEENCRKADVPVQRRSSGGGTVLLGPGCLLFSLVLAYDRDPHLGDIHGSYAYILGKIRSALQLQIPEIELAGTSDLMIGGKKFSGNAQQRKRNFVLHHGSILYGFPISEVGRFLRLPSRQPDYRQHRDHADFLMNLPMGREDIIQTLTESWEANQLCPNWPSQEVDRLVLEKYSRDSWLRRR